MDSNGDNSKLQALEKLFRRFYKPLRAYAFRFVNDKDVAEDIVQDAFLELWSRRDYIRFDDNSVQSYLFKTVYNRSINVINKKIQENQCSLDQGNEDLVLDQYLYTQIQDSEQILMLKELDNEIAAFIETLPPQCKKIFLLSRTYELKNREIAEQLGISIKAVEKQISKALFGLKTYLIEKELISLFLVAGFNF
jgi:RNA polymerase sigma-70 factor (ECF subfamily)